MSTENDSNLPEKAKPWALTQELLANYPKEKFNLLLPTITVADVKGQLHKPVVEVVIIDPTLPIRERGRIVKEGSGEVYQDKRMAEGTVALTRRGLQKFQHAAGVQYPPQLNGVQEIQLASMCLYKAAGAIKKADGTLLIVPASKLVDLGLEEIKFRAQAENRNEWRIKDGKTPWTEAEIEAQVRRDVIQARENMVPNAETKAQNRVLRKILALKDAYTIEELKKPFVVIRFDQSFNLDDPLQAQMLLAQATTSSGALYGPPAPGADPTPAQGPPAGQEVPQDAPGDDLDEPLDEGDPERDFPPSAVEELVALGYDEMKVRFKKAVDELKLEAGERETILYSWRIVHSKPEAERPELFAGLILELEQKAA